MIVQRMKVEVTRADIASTDGAGRNEAPFLALEAALRREFPGKSFEVGYRRVFRTDIDDPDGTPLPPVAREWIINGRYGALGPTSFDLAVWW